MDTYYDSEGQLRAARTIREGELFKVALKPLPEHRGYWDGYTQAICDILEVIEEPHDKWKVQGLIGFAEHKLNTEGRTP